MNAVTPSPPAGSLRQIPQPGGWRADQRKTVYLAALVLALCIPFLLHYANFVWGAHRSQTPGHVPMYGDFFALWSYVQLIRQYPMAELYDYHLTFARQIALGMDPDQTYPFPYPPTFALLFWPLGLLPYEPDFLVFILGSLAAFVWVVWKTCSRRPFCLAGLVVAPSTTATIFAGQAGFVMAAVMTAGVRLVASRPIVAGVLIGVLSVKPQLGMLIPVALVAARLWAALITACATVAALAVIATLAFGVNTWAAWLSMLPGYSAWFDSVRAAWPIRPTVIANLQMLGVALPWAKAIQALVAAWVAILVWNCFRRDPGPLAAAALLAGSALATPHAFFYDLPVVSAAMIILIEDRMQPGQTFSTLEVVSLSLVMLFPALMVLPQTQFPVSTVSLALLFYAIVRRQCAR